VLDVIGLLYGIKLLLNFTRYSTNIQNMMWWSVCLCLLQISWGMFLPKISKIERHLTGVILQK